MKYGYAICLNEWIEDDTIQKELNILLRISSLTAQTGFCYASNTYFSERLNVSEETISRRISKLQKKGYIKIEYETRGCEVINRKIRINGLTKKSIDDCQKNQSTDDKNVKGNTTSINTTSNNKEKNNKKKKYGEFKNVLLSDEQFKKLQDKYPDTYNQKIKMLDEGIELKGYKYKNHLLAIQRWAEKEERGKAGYGTDKRVASANTGSSGSTRGKYADL